MVMTEKTADAIERAADQNDDLIVAEALTRRRPTPIPP
jgi:hypothetical protein